MSSLRSVPLSYFLREADAETSEEEDGTGTRDDKEGTIRDPVSCGKGSLEPWVVVGRERGPRLAHINI